MSHREVQILAAPKVSCFPLKSKPRFLFSPLHVRFFAYLLTSNLAFCLVHQCTFGYVFASLSSLGLCGWYLHVMGDPD